MTYGIHNYLKILTCRIEIESMTLQIQMMNRQMSSMKRRIKALEKISTSPSGEMDEQLDRLTQKIEKANEQV